MTEYTTDNVEELKQKLVNLCMLVLFIGMGIGIAIGKFVL